MSSASEEDRASFPVEPETDEPLATWQPPHGRTYRVIAWIILIGFLLSVLGALLLVMYNGLGLHRMS